MATQFIFHTAVTRDLDGLRDYFCSGRSGGIESHFGVGGKWGNSLTEDGRLEQWRDTSEQADANRTANVRALSVETTDNAPARAADIELWTPKQVDTLIRLGRWAADVHGIPKRICRNPRDPGFGWHAMWDNTQYEYSDGSTPWTPSAGKECPGPKRIAQLKNVILPAIFSGTTPREEGLSMADVQDILVALADLKTTVNNASRLIRVGDEAGPDDTHDYSSIEGVTYKVERLENLVRMLMYGDARSPVPDTHDDLSMEGLTQRLARVEADTAELLRRVPAPPV